MVIITVINNEGNIEWFIFHIWKSLSCCPSWRWSQHLPFTVCVSILDWFLLMSWQVCSALLDAWILSSPTELCRSAMPGSLTLSSSARGNTLLPQTLLWDRGRSRRHWEVWWQNLQDCKFMFSTQTSQKFRIFPLLKLQFAIQMSVCGHLDFSS